MDDGAVLLGTKVGSWVVGTRVVGTNDGAVVGIDDVGSADGDHV